jgi:hypothetical protein
MFAAGCDVYQPAEACTPRLVIIDHSPPTLGRSRLTFARLLHRLSPSRNWP